MFSPGMAFPAFGQHRHKGWMSASFFSLSFRNPSCDSAFLHLLRHFPQTHPYFLIFALVRILVAKNRNLSDLLSAQEEGSFPGRVLGTSRLRKEGLALASEGRRGHRTLLPPLAPSLSGSLHPFLREMH